TPTLPPSPTRRSSDLPPIDFEKAVAWCQKRTGKTLAPSQRDALKTVLAKRVVVITGGPGVGKTTLVNSILMILTTRLARTVFSRSEEHTSELQSRGHL